jgi:hypothetical protein
MKVQELLDKLNNILKDRPHLKDAEVVIDVEARRFDYHLVSVQDLTAEEESTYEDFQEKWVTIYPDYYGSEL